MLLWLPSLHGRLMDDPLHLPLLLLDMDDLGLVRVALTPRPVPPQVSAYLLSESRRRPGTEGRLLGLTHDGVLRKGDAVL